MVGKTQAFNDMIRADLCRYDKVHKIVPFLQPPELDDQKALSLRQTFVTAEDPTYLKLSLRWR